MSWPRRPAPVAAPARRCRCDRRLPPAEAARRRAHDRHATRACRTGASPGPRGDVSGQRAGRVIGAVASRAVQFVPWCGRLPPMSARSPREAALPRGCSARGVVGGGGARAVHVHAGRCHERRAHCRAASGTCGRSGCSGVGSTISRSTSDALMTWNVQRRAGLRVLASSPSVRDGAVVLCGIGPAP